MSYKDIGMIKGSKTVPVKKTKALSRRDVREKVTVNRADEWEEILPLDTDILNDKPTYRFVKRFFDILLSTGALVLLSPFLVGVAIAIVIDDPHDGPLFIQERVGKNGKHFRILKFRSMIKGADAMKKELEAMGINLKSPEDPTYKAEDDPRNTRLGALIRKISVDELPQLINIIKGDMSIVGPRPLVVDEVEKMNAFAMQRHLVRPGLTCYWQAASDRHDIKFDKWMKMDVEYIHNCSLWEDIKVIFRTVGIVFTGNNK